MKAAIHPLRPLTRPPVRSAFSLVELMVVIVIIGLLFAIVSAALISSLHGELVGPVSGDLQNTFE